MKLVSFERNGRAGFGAVIDGGVVDLGAALNGRHADLMALLAADALGEARTALADRAADFALDSVVLLPVIPAPGKIWCCGLNYGEHVRETNREITEQPTFFLRVADSQVGHGQAIVRPPESVQLDYEAEIAVIIGKPGRRIAEADVWDHIAGYSCYNDGSVRDWQRHTSQWGPGKNFWRTGGFGPWMVTTDQIPARTVMTLVTRLNGQEMQRATTEMMIHSIERQIAYVSTIAPLQAGDVVEIEVDRVGVLRNTIADDA